MVLGLFKKHYAVCNDEVLKKEAIAFLGLSFCSFEHAKRYEKKIISKVKKPSGGSGCCGL